MKQEEFFIKIGIMYLEPPCLLKLRPFCAVFFIIGLVYVYELLPSQLGHSSQKTLGQDLR